jgi:hypothetical protein
VDRLGVLGGYNGNQVVHEMCRCAYPGILRRSDGTKDTRTHGPVGAA